VSFALLVARCCDSECADSGGEQGGEGRGDARLLQRLHEDGREARLAPRVRAHEAPKLCVDRLRSLRGLLLKSAESREFTVLGQQFLHPGAAQGADQLALEIGDAREEAERLQVCIGGTEAGSLNGTPHVRGLSYVEESDHAPTHRIAAQNREVVVQVRHAAHRHNGRPGCEEVDIEPRGERFDREPVALPLDEHDGDGCLERHDCAHEPTLSAPTGGGSCAGPDMAPLNSVSTLILRQGVSPYASAMTHRRSSTLPVLLFVSIALTGCVATPAPTPTPSPPPATLSETPSAEPATEPAAASAATCDTVFTADAYAKLADDGLEQREPPSVDQLAYYPMAAQLVEAGGLSCHWGKPQTDIGLTVTQLSDADSAVWAPALADAGFVETNDPVTGTYTGPVDGGTGIPPIVVVTGDSLTFVSAPTFAGWIAPTS
jgi:hypothetical protein